VDSNTRNARVVICLILAMTAGARILLWLEPAPTSTERFAQLAAMGGARIDDVLIAYAPPGEPLEGATCLIWPDGRREYDQLGPNIRLVVVGKEGGPLPEEQKQALLGVLGSIAWGRAARGTETPSIHVDRNSDARLNPSLGGQARELYDMLVAKRFID
jgi:hypothetical protein